MGKDMNRHWRFLLAILLLGLWRWVSTTPSSAHHATDGAEPGVADTNGGDTDVANADLSAPDFPAPTIVQGAAVALPPNFIIRTVASGLNLPTDIAILPSGDLLVTEKGVG